MGDNSDVTPDELKRVFDGGTLRRDATLNGQTAEALAQLDRLLLAGEAPIALLGQVASN